MKARRRVVYRSSQCPAKQPERQFKVGDRLLVSLSSGRIEEAVVKAVVNDADGVRLQVDFGHDETALVYT